jgi:hypothetical protein
VVEGEGSKVGGGWECRVLFYGPIFGDFRAVLGVSGRGKGRERDEWFQEKLAERGVFLGLGEKFFAERWGWYKVTFSVERRVLEEGLRRLGAVLDEIKRESAGQQKK